MANHINIPNFLGNGKHDYTINNPFCLDPLDDDREIIS